MVRLLVYSFASVVDIVLSAVIFVCMVRVADMGSDALTVSALLTVWAAVYMVASLVAGLLTTRRSAAWLLIGSCLASVALAVAFNTFTGLRAMYVLMALQGWAAAFFFTPFQVFMKYVDLGQSKGVSHSAGLYTCCWSTGFALGPLFAGFVWNSFSWRACHWVNVVLAGAVALGVYLLKHYAHVDPATDSAPEGAPATEVVGRGGRPNLAWMAWVFGGTGCLIASMIRSVFPSSGAAWEISKPDQGTVLFLFCGVQAVVGLILCRSRDWMYRPVPVLVFGLCGVGAMGLFAVARTPLAFGIAASLFGIYSGSFYFYLVFHSLVHPTRSGRYVAVNESVVGLASIIGPLAGGVMANRFGLSSPYLGAMGLLALAVLIQSAVHAGANRPKAGLEAVPAAQM